jgi:hypothetical protein
MRVGVVRSCTFQNRAETKLVLSGSCRNQAIEKTYVALDGVYRSGLKQHNRFNASAWLEDEEGGYSC